MHHVAHLVVVSVVTLEQTLGTDDHSLLFAVALKISSMWSYQLSIVFSGLFLDLSFGSSLVA